MDDYKIVNLYWERSELAINETDKKYGKLCRYIAANILSNNEDVEECVNDTYFAAWNSMPTERPVSLSAYISKITRNLSLKKYEYLSAKKRNYEVAVSFSELEDCVSGKISTEDEIDDDSIEQAINDFLRLLNYETRNVFLRRYWFFDSIHDIANKFQMSESKVISILFRTRNKLKIYLEKEGIYL